MARPIGVLPRICNPSALHRKWSDQRSDRGLNNGTRCPVERSTAAILLRLRALQFGHDQARFVKSVGPLRDAGRM